MAENLEIKVSAETGQAVADLKKTETAVAGVTKEVKKLDEESKKASKGGIGGDLSESLNKTTGGFTKMLEATGKISLIFGAAVAAGKALGAALDYVITRVSKASAAKQEAEARTIRFHSALKLAEKGTIDLGRSTEQMLANYDAYIAKMRESTAATEAQARALKEYQLEVEGLSEATAAAGRSTAFQLLSPEEANAQLDSVRALAQGLNDLLGKAFREGGAEERDAWAQANKDAVEKVMGYFKEFPEKAPEYVRQAYEAMNAAAETLDFAGINAQYEANVARQKEWIAEQDRVNAGMAEWTAKTQGASSAFGALSGDFTAINASMAEFYRAGGQTKDVMVGMAEVAMTWQRSTEAMNRTLERQLEIMGRLDEKMATTLEKYEQWRSAIATAVSSLQDGTTSASGFIAIMNSLATQLSQNFGAAAGEAGDEVRKLIATIQALIATATTGGAGNIDPTLWGGLERQYGKGRK